jgi:hypothetical protein
MPKKFDMSVHQLTVWKDSLIEFAEIRLSIVR